MRFDDRLKTVMTQPVADAHDRTVRWRQLVDLMSRPHDAIDPALFDAALTMIRTGTKAVARPIRAATARSIAGRATDPRLLAIFAADRLEVAAPVLAAAPLDEEGWEQVMKAASDEVAAFIRSVRGTTEASAGPPKPATETPLPPREIEAAEDQEPAPIAEVTAPSVVEEPAPSVVEEPAPSIGEETAPSIGEMVARIERLKNRRSGDAERPESTPHEPGRSQAEASAMAGPSLFHWECDASGQIGWVDGVPRGALIGRSIPGDDGADRRLARAFADRMPFDDAGILIPSPALEGEWKLSGIPAFSPSDGRFLGYRGIGRKEVDDGIPASPLLGGMPPAEDAEALRETIHEIKTPLNAIIGFAEIIDGQYLGPAHRNYRERAAEIVSQARILLAAIEDLDFAARMKGAAGKGDSTSADAVLTPLGEEMIARAAPRRIDIRIIGRGGRLAFALERDLADRLLRRFVGAVIDAAEQGEQIRVAMSEERGKVLLSITRPAATSHLSARQLLDPAFHTASEGEESRLGLGFGLRLVRGLVRLAGGELRLGATDFILAIPAAKH